MKHKTWAVLPILCVGLLSACSKPGTYNPPKKEKITKQSVLKDSQRSFKSGELIDSVQMNDGKTHQSVITKFEFGNEPTVFHVISQTKSGKKRQGIEAYLDENKSYMHGKDWYKVNYRKLTGHTYADFVEDIVDNDSLFRPNKKLVKAYKLTGKKRSRQVLTATTTDEKTMKEIAEPIARTVGQNPLQNRLFKTIASAKQNKYQIMTSKITVQNRRMIGYTVFVTSKYGKNVVKFGQSYGQMGTHDNLSVPDSVSNEAQDLTMKKIK